jgi:hypothetical protein
MEVMLKVDSEPDTLISIVPPAPPLLPADAPEAPLEEPFELIAAMDTVEEAIVDFIVTLPALQPADTPATEPPVVVMLPIAMLPPVVLLMIMLPPVPPPPVLLLLVPPTAVKTGVPEMFPDGAFKVMDPAFPPLAEEVAEPPPTFIVGLEVKEMFPPELVTLTAPPGFVLLVDAAPFVLFPPVDVRADKVTVPLVLLVSVMLPAAPGVKVLTAAPPELAIVPVNVIPVAADILIAPPEPPLAPEPPLPAPPDAVMAVPDTEPAVEVSETAPPLPATPPAPEEFALPVVVIAAVKEMFPVLVVMVTAPEAPLATAELAAPPDVVIVLEPVPEMPVPAE